MSELTEPYDVERQAMRPGDRRDAVRLKAQFCLTISTDQALGGLIVSTASVRDVSNGGALVVSRLWLTPFQDVMLAIPTTEAGHCENLPEAFLGPATVVRVQKGDGTTNLVGLRFGNSIRRNAHFQTFISSLQACDQLQ